VHRGISYFSRKVLFSAAAAAATMAWVVGMADDENPEAGAGASQGKKRKKQKARKRTLFAN